MKKPSHKKQKKQTNKKKNKKKPYTLIPSVLTEMFALLKAGIQIQFTKKMCEFTTGAPAAILPLIKNFTTLPKLTRNWTMSLLIRLKLISWITKYKRLLQGHPNISSKDVLRLLSFSDAERDYVECTASMHWQGEEWYFHNASLLTSKVDWHYTWSLQPTSWIAIIQSFSWLLLSRILDFAITFFKIKIRGTMYINLEKQTLNQQWGLSLSFSLFLVHCIFQIDILLIFVFVQCFLFSWFMSKYHYCRPVL